MAKHRGKQGLLRTIIREYGKCENPTAQGPVGLLMQDLRAIGATIDENLNVQAADEATVNMWHIPWQHLRRAVADMAIRSRTRKAAENRRHLQGVREIDAPIMK
eukprot:5825052-Karenia_brevis.AAC.1